MSVMGGVGGGWRGREEEGGVGREEGGGGGRRMEEGGGGGGGGGGGRMEEGIGRRDVVRVIHCSTVPADGHSIRVRGFFFG